MAAQGLVTTTKLVQPRFFSKGGVGREHYEPGQDVFHQGDLGDRVYMIQSGRVEVRRRDEQGERVIAQLGPGECFGEMALLAGNTRSASVQRDGSEGGGRPSPHAPLRYGPDFKLEKHAQGLTRPGATS